MHLDLLHDDEGTASKSDKSLHSALSQTNPAWVHAKHETEHVPPDCLGPTLMETAGVMTTCLPKG